MATKRRKIIRVGIDMDGVLARHSVGGFWVWVRKVKENLLKKSNCSSYYYPTSWIERFTWKIINERKKPFSTNIRILQRMKNDGNFRFFLVTGRFKFMEEQTRNWLAKYKLDSVFEKILINIPDIDPMTFKKKTIEKYDLDVYIEDDLEIINFLKGKTKTKYLWVVPHYRHESENKDEDVVVCKNLSEALKKISATFC